MTNLLKLAFVAVVWLFAMRADAAPCPEGYNCERLAEIAAENQAQTAATIAVLGGVAVLYDTPCNMGPESFSFSVFRNRPGQQEALTGGCWRFSTARPGYLEYSGSDGGDLWPLCAVKFYGKYSKLNADVAKRCKGK